MKAAPCQLARPPPRLWQGFNRPARQASTHSEGFTRQPPGLQALSGFQPPPDPQTRRISLTLHPFSHNANHRLSDECSFVLREAITFPATFRNAQRAITPCH